MTTRPISTGGPADQVTSAAKRYGGGYSRLLDTYAYTSFNLGEARATVRLGKQVMNWGESMFFANIAGAGPQRCGQGGIAWCGNQGNPAARRPDLGIAGGQPKLSLLAHYQFGFHETLLPAVGMYTSTTNLIGPGANCGYRAGPACYLPRATTSVPASPVSGYRYALPSDE